jgi:DNA-binding NtrC family response regulator
MKKEVMAKILLVGYIADLLRERERILHAAGHEVTAAYSFVTASTAIDGELFDAAVLGYTVPENERNQLARALKQANPAAKIIMIYFDSLTHTQLADALLQTTASAEDVLRAVNHILNPQARPPS